MTAAVENVTFGGAEILARIGGLMVSQAAYPAVGGRQWRRGRVVVDGFRFAVNR